MKKIFILLFLILPFFVNAQLFEGGIIGGLTASQVDGDDFGGYHKLGFSVTTYAQLNLRNELNLISGVSIVQKGARSATKTTFFVTRLNYVEVPVFFTYMPFDKLSFSGGLTFGYLFKGENEQTFGVFDEDDLNLRWYDLSYYTAVNYKISDRLTINFANDYNLIPVTKPSSGNCLSNHAFFSLFIGPSTSICWWNNSLRLTAQYLIFWKE
ncbi:MAG: outer membrane beta-barrel protein [Bacteroidales bacterium]|nr:outer membrane beta-barrel protein [Bacteroidales bacterium]